MLEWRCTICPHEWTVGTARTKPLGIRVSRQEFGNQWPLTVPEGTLRCETDGPRQLVALDTGDGIQYGINGSARSFGFQTVKRY